MSSDSAAHHDDMATLAKGDSFSTMLRRAGVSASDIGRVSALVGDAMPLSEIEPGTKLVVARD